MNDSSFYEYPLPRVSEDAEGDEESHWSRPRRYFPDTYLDSPILITKRLKWMLYDDLEPPTDPKTMQDRTLRDLKQTDLIGSDYDIVDPDQYQVHYNYPWPSTITDELDTAMEVSHAIYQTVAVALDKHWNIKIPVIASIIPPLAQVWLDKWSYMDSLVEKFSEVCADRGPNVVQMKLGDHTSVIATKDVWWLKCRDIGAFLYTYDQILMLKDLFYSRAQAYLAASLMYPHNGEITRAITMTCSWHEKCLTRYGNGGFEILKQTESLSKAYMSEMTDPIFGTDGPYGRMLDKVRNKEQSKGATTFLADEFDSVLRSCRDIQTIVEIFGLLKISGHPLVDPVKGGQTSASLAQEISTTLYRDAQELDWEFKRVFLESYVRKNGCWPNLTFAPDPKNLKLRRLYRRQYRALNRKSYPLSDWQYCRFGKVVDFDYSPNYLDLIDDKAISLYRSNLAATWDSDVKQKSHRRLLMELITREELNVKDIVVMIIRREIPLDWFVVCVHPKEREFKESPRMFSMLVFEIRMFFALTEANLGDQIFPYLPQQTMVESKIAIGRRFLEMTRPITTEDSLRMFYELDLSSWNLLWRGTTVNPVARTLNDMFGVVGIFDFCHEFFAKCVIVVRVQDLRPDGIELDPPKPGPLVWYNHLGGFEGICQKLWTICTYSMVALALRDMPLSYQLTGQADNQIMSIVTARNRFEPVKETLTRLRDEITANLTDRCERTGQILKPEECLESTSTITYSKDIYIAGVYRATSLKFHSRLFPHSSQIFPSIRTNIGSIFSTAVSGAEKSAHPLTSYYLACFYSCLYLARVAHGRGPYGRIFKSFKDSLNHRFNDFLYFCLSLPSEAGGFPIIPFVGFLYKGGSDPLGKSLSAMTVLGLKGNNKIANRMLSQMSTEAIYSPNPKLGQLFMDPFSIPLAKPPTSVDGVASETIAALRGKIATREIRQLTEADTIHYLDELVDVLKDCRPLNPLIMRDILDCSVAGVTDTVSRMFVATRTLQQVVRELGIPIVEKILHLEEKGLRYYFNRFKMLPSTTAPIKTAFSLTTELRSRWIATDRTAIVGLTTYQPLDFQMKWGPQCLMTTGVSAVLVASSDPLETRGPYDPYVGSKTREKRSEHGYKIVGTDTASRALRKLQLIASQTGNDPIFTMILDVVGWSRTNTTLSAVSDLLPGIDGGTLSHRYAARAGHQDAFNLGSPNFATHCVVSTDNAGEVAGGMLDYPIMMQEPLLIVLWALQAKYQETHDEFLAVTLDFGSVQMEPLPSVDIMGPDKLKLRVMRFTDNALAFIPHLQLERVAGAVNHRSLPLSTVFTPTATLRRHILEAHYKAKFRSHSLGRQMADGSRQHFQGDVIDIAEAASNGLTHLTKAMAYAIADEAISNFMMTSIRGRDRWRLEPYIYSLVSPCVQTISPLLGHPLLQSDPLVKKLYLYDSPTYAGGMTVAYHRLCSYVAGLTLELLRGYTDGYNHRSIGLFTSDNPRIASETLLTCFLVDMYTWLQQNELSEDAVHHLVATQIIPAYRHEHDEERRVDILIQAAMNAKTFYRLTNPTVSQVLAKYRRTRLVGYKATCKDLLKATRNTDEWGLPPEGAAIPSKIIALPRQLPPSRWIDQTFRSAESLQGVRPLTRTSDTQLERLIATYNRNLGRFSLASGSALHLWTLFAALFKRKPLLLVGSGMGAVARVALDAGCPFVHGVDLRTTIPLKAHRFRYYKPPMVMSCEYQDRYVQMPESFTTNGDWFNSTVSQAVLSSDPGDATIVLDMQSGEERHGLEILAPLLGVKTAGTVICRFYLTDHETDAIIGDLLASGAVFSWYDIQSTTEVKPRVCVISRLPLLLLMNIGVHPVTNSSLIELPSQLSTDDAADYRLALSDGIYNLVYVEGRATQTDVTILLDVIIGSSKGDYESRLAYDSWTKLLRAKVIVEWSLLDENARIRAIREWLETGWATATIAGSQELVKADYSLCRHAVTYGARMIRTA